MSCEPSGRQRRKRSELTITTPRKKVSIEARGELRLMCAVRTRGAGAYQFSLDDQKRAEQMASLKGQRLETERVRNEASKRVLSGAQEAQKRKVEERRALIEAKRRKVMGGDKVDALREEKRKAEADKFLSGLEKELHGGDGDAVPKLE